MTYERLFATGVSKPELARDWALSIADLAEVRRCRGNDNRHRFARFSSAHFAPSAGSPTTSRAFRCGSRHDLARRLFFANRGAFRNGDDAEIMNKVTALSVLSNAALVWNTVGIGAIVDALAAAGHDVAREDLARVSPMLDAHVIATGSYHFDRAVRSRPEGRSTSPRSGKSATAEA